MHSVNVTVSAADRGPDEVFAALADLTAMPARTPQVLSVTDLSAGGEQVTSWEVAFGAGVLRWTERDHTDFARRRLAFELVDGDIPVFAGHWQVRADGTGVSASFQASFDFLLPTLETALGPVAGAALVHNVTSILYSILGPQARVQASGHAPVAEVA